MSIESGEKVQREVFKVIMIAPFITLSASCLREKSFNRNAEQVRSLYTILLLLGGCRGVNMCVFDIGPHWCSTVCTYGGSTVCICTGTGVQIYRYGRSTFLLRVH